jgi:iron(III) transport system permease protein
VVPLMTAGSGRLCHELRHRRGRALRHAAAGRARADAPLAYGIYVYMQSAAGRGPGAALGVIAVVVVSIATYLAYRVAERERGLKSRAF